MLRVAFLVAILMALARTAPGQPAERPNLLLISADTLRADRVNAYGYGEHRVSPNIDLLARDGIVFESHTSSAPWTTPAHVSMFTSLHPSGHGIVQSFSDFATKLRSGRFNKLPESALTLAEALASSGYATAAFTGGVTLDPAIGFDQGFETYDTSMYKLSEENMAGVFQWLGEHANEPWFIFLHTFEVHAPYLQSDFLPERTASWRAEYDELASSLASTQSLDEHEGANQAIIRFLKQHGAFEPAVCEALYMGGVKSLDDWIGRILAELRRNELYDDTMILFTSDHGEEFSEHHENKFYDHHGHSAYEEMVRVPLIVKLPGQQHADTRQSAVSSTVDVMPTALDVLGIRLASHEMQGASLRPLWEQGDPGEDRVAVTEAANQRDEIKSLRTKRYKYVIRIDAESVAEHGRSHIPEGSLSREMFDLEADPQERSNLLGWFASRSATERADALDARLRELVDGRHRETEEVELDEQTLKQLRSLGYVD